MLSAKLDPKIYSVDLHFVLYFTEFWKNMLYFFTFYNKNDCKPLKMININDQYDNLVVYLDKKSHVWDFIAFGTLCNGQNFVNIVCEWPLVLISFFHVRFNPFQKCCHSCINTRCTLTTVSGTKTYNAHLVPWAVGRLFVG